MHALLLYLHSACQYFAISSGHMTVTCDNKTVISLCNYQGLSPPPDTAHLDLVRAIWSLHNISSLSLTFRHIRGHQDDWVAVSRLEPLAQLNVGADTLAKEHLQHLLQTGHVTSPLPLASEVWSCWLGSTKIIHNPHRSLSHHLGIQSAKTYLVQKQLFSPAAFELVDWEAWKSATASLPDQLSMWSGKFISGHCAVGRTMLRWKQWTHSQCPCCALPDETSQHVLLCMDPGLHRVYCSGIDSLRLWLTRMNTDPQIMACLCDTLIDSAHRDFPFFASPGYTMAATDQAAIGSFSTLMGCLARSWQSLQAQYLLSVGSRWSTSRWSAQLSRKLIEFSHSIWAYRNSVLHAQNEQGRATALATLQTQIKLQFALGLQDLLPADHVYVTRFSPTSLATLPLSNQERWLATVQLARDHGRTSLSSELSSMRRRMHTFLGLDN